MKQILKILRKKVNLAKTMIKETLKATNENEIVFLGLNFERKELEQLEETFEKAEKEENLERLKELLKEETIPLLLLSKGELWRDIQNLIYQLQKEKSDQDFER